MEDSKKELILPIVSVVKKEVNLETCSLENHNHGQDNMSYNFEIKQEQTFSGENGSSVPSEVNIEKLKVHNEPQDCCVKLESEHIINKNICMYKNELRARIEEKNIKLENECEEVHDSKKGESVIVTEFNNVLTSDPLDKFNNVLTSDLLALNAEEEKKFIGKEKSSIGSLVQKVEKEEKTGSILRQSGVDLFTGISQRSKARSAKDNNSSVAQNGQSRMDNLQFECSNENESMYNDHHSNTKYLSSSLSKGITYICDICNKSFSRRNRLYKHMLRHLGMIKKERKVYCSVCNKSFNSQYLKKHMSVHDGLRFTCDMCNKSFSTKDSLGSHMKKHILCNKQKPSLACHTVIHNRFTCEVCSKVFSSISAVETHAKIHNKKEYICEICNKCFSTKNYVQRHISYVHSYSQYSCKICFKTYNKQSSLQAHLSLHTDNIYVCDTCKRSFKTKFCLYQHILGHLGIRKKPKQTKRIRKSTIMYCSICNRSFGRIDHLKRHIRSIHDGIRFTCDVCNCSHATKDTLVRHMEKHLIDFECNICKKPYIDQYTLDLHKKRRHTADFTCNKCNKSYGIKSSLLSHIAQKHSNAQKHFNVEFICNECHKSYGIKGSLVRHIAQKHFNRF